MAKGFHENKAISLGVIYRKPGTNFDEFKNELDILLQTINLDRNSSIIMGDFNVDLTQKEEKGNEFLRLTESYSLNKKE